MKIGITGASGHVGRNLILSLENDHQIKVLLREPLSGMPESVIGNLFDEKGYNY